jgi:hypothetical protein
MARDIVLNLDLVGKAAAITRVRSLKTESAKR